MTRWLHFRGTADAWRNRSRRANFIRAWPAAGLLQAMKYNAFHLNRLRVKPIDICCRDEGSQFRFIILPPDGKRYSHSARHCGVMKNGDEIYFSWCRKHSSVYDISSLSMIA